MPEERESVILYHTLCTGVATRFYFEGNHLISYWHQDGLIVGLQTFETPTARDKASKIILKHMKQQM